MSDSDPEPDPESDADFEAEPGVEGDMGVESDTEELDLPDPQLGRATVVYDNPNGEQISREVDNEHIVYFQDHWQLKTGTDADGNDVIRRIPRHRVHYVERSVEEFEDRVDALLNQARERLPF